MGGAYPCHVVLDERLERQFEIKSKDRPVMRSAIMSQNKIPIDMGSEFGLSNIVSA